MDWRYNFAGGTEVAHYIKKKNLENQVVYLVDSWWTTPIAYLPKTKFYDLRRGKFTSYFIFYYRIDPPNQILTRSIADILSFIDHHSQEEKVLLISPFSIQNPQDHQLKLLIAVDKTLKEDYFLYHYRPKS